MARTKINQRSVDVPMGATGGRIPPSKMTVLLLVTCVVSAVWAAGMLTPFGRQAYVYLFLYSEYYMGVLTLVSLSITVMIGLVATDRLVLSIRQRVLLQSAHRTTGVIAVGALLVHVVTKVSTDRIAAVDVFVPFLAPYNTLYIGLGTISGLLLVSVLWTGLARARFAGRGKPWMWRSLHSVAYLAWPIALVHGLSAGRAAAPWVIVSYLLCVLFVLVGLAVRLSVSLNRKKDFSSTVTGALKPVGSLVPTAAPTVKKRISRRREEPEPVAEVPAWKPAATPARVAVAAGPSSSAAPVSPSPFSVPPVGASPVSPAPVSGSPVSGSPVSGSPVSGSPFGDDGPIRGSRRYAGDDEPRYEPRDRHDDGSRPGSPRRRPAPAVRYDEEYPRYTEEPVRRRPDDEYSGRPRRPVDEQRYDSAYDTARYDTVPSDESRYDQSRYDRSRYDGARYDEARYDEARYDQPRYDDQPPVRRAITSRALTSAPHSRHADEVPEPSRGAAPRRYAEEPPAARRPVEEPPPPRRYAEDAPVGRRYAEDTATGRRYAEEAPAGRGYGDEPRSRGRLRAEDAVSPPYAGSRYDDRDPAGPPFDDRGPGYDERPPRRGRSADQGSRYRGDRYAGDGPAYPADRDPGPGRADAGADAGRHSRSEFVDLAEPADPNYLPPDETPTLVDMAARRARRANRPESVRAGRRGARGPAATDTTDEHYWQRLRGEAQ